MKLINELAEKLNIDVTNTNKIKRRTKQNYNKKEKRTNNTSLSSKIIFYCPVCSSEHLISNISQHIKCNGCNVDLYIVKCPSCYHYSIDSTPRELFICEHCNETKHIKLCNSCHNITLTNLTFKKCKFCGNELTVNPLLSPDLTKTFIASAIIYFVGLKLQTGKNYIIEVLEHFNMSFLKNEVQSHSEFIESLVSNEIIFNEIELILNSDEKAILLNIILKILAIKGDLNDNGIDYLYDWFTKINLSKYVLSLNLQDYFFVVDFNFSEYKNIQSYPDSIKIYIFMLGLEDKNISLKNIRKAYYEQARKYHPDKNIHLSEANKKIVEKIFIEKQNAYEVLVNYFENIL